MATTNVMTALGASDIDTKELTVNLVAATKEPRQKLIDLERKKAEVAISSAALLKSGLAALQAAATEIGSTSKLNKVQVTTTNAAVVSGSPVATATAKTGTYSVTVEALATPKRISAAFPSDYKTSAPITLTMNVPGAKAGAVTTINIAADKTPADIVSAVNAWVTTNAPDSGLTVSLLNTGKTPNPLSIVMQGASGAANAFEATATFTGSGTPPLAAPELAFTQITAAANARFTVNGIAIERGSNKVTDAINGLSLELNAVSGTPAVISAKPDPSSIVQNIKNFVDTYNTIADFLRKATGPKVAGDEVAGSLQNDSSARSVLSRLRSTITARFSELDTKPVSITHWSSLGVEFDRNGVLQFEKESRFIEAFEKNPAEVVTVLSNDAPSPYVAAKLPSGLAGDVARVSYDLISSSDSTIAAMSKGYQDKIDRVAKKQAALDAYVERITANYERQFAAMSSVLASFKSTQSQLTNAMNLKSND
jgi:flagellar hook-associated protein 2